MPTPTTGSTNAAAPAEGGGFALASAPAYGALKQGLRLKPQHAWTWMVHPARLTVRRGRLVPQLCKAGWRPGNGGNDGLTYEQGQRGQGAILALQHQGWIPVPQDMPGLTTFGQPRKPTETAVTAYLDRYVSTDGAIRFVDAWSRPVQVGDQVLWERDEEGFDAFLARCMALMYPGEVPRQLAEAAVAPVLRNVRRLMERSDPRGQRMARELIAAIPAEYIPQDVSDFYAPPKALPTPPAEAEADAKPRRAKA